jgi:hypothetical protein
MKYDDKAMPEHVYEACRDYMRIGLFSLLKKS